MINHAVEKLYERGTSLIGCHTSLPRSVHVVEPVCGGGNIIQLVHHNDNVIPPPHKMGIHIK